MGRAAAPNAPFALFPITGDDVICPDNPIKASNLQFAYSKTSNFNLKQTDTPVTVTTTEWIASNNGTIKSFVAQVHVPGSAASVTVDLKVNGTTVLAAPITLTNATTADTNVAASISTPSYSAGAVITFVMTVSTSTGMQGVAARLNGVENFQPV